MLEYRFPELAQAVAAAPPARQRSAARVATELALARTSTSGREVKQALSALDQGRFGQHYEWTMVKDLADRLEAESEGEADERYWQSCAAAALAWALYPQPRRAADESIFCAIVALREDLTELEPAVRAELEA